ncbi:MAG: hypothetical protein HYZ28_23535 [Myxococcales bacterium]|nr:hypothetical protein [Myxococcales bacterium]
MACRSSAILALVVGLGSACGGPVRGFEGGFNLPRTPQIDGYTLSAVAGIHEEGSLRRLSLLATARDESGSGPRIPWQLIVVNPRGVEMAQSYYDDDSAGSFMAWWWDGVAPEPGLYALDARAPSGSASLRFEVPDFDGIAPADPGYAADTGRLSWTPVGGAASYACKLLSAAVVLSSTSPSREPFCDFGPLDDGSYGARVLAFSADLPALAESRIAGPLLPEAFHVSEASIGFARAGGTSGQQLRAVLGTLNYGPAGAALALWVSLVDGAGSPPAQEWEVAVSGPNLPEAQPLRARVPPGQAQALLWWYDVRAREGEYSVRASAAGSSVATGAAVGDTAVLPTPLDVSVAPSPSGSADVSWSPVPEARSYRVSAWKSGAQTPTAAQWVAAPPAGFSPGTFASGERYDVYVAAATVDMTGALGNAPSRVQVSENAYAPASFTAP